MIKYQTIHNLLLRLSRVNTVIRTLYWDVTHQSESTPDPVKVGVDSGLKRPPSGGRQQSRVMKAVLMSASSVEHRLHRLRFRMSHFVAALSRYVLDTAIGSNWDVMRRRLERLKRRIPGLDESRPPTPLREEDNDFVFEPVLEDDEEEAEPISIGQLQSIHSLVLYHHMTLDRILGSCLLSPHTGHQVTLKILTALFGLVLDLGKLVKEVERGFVGLKQGEARIKGIAADWEEKEAVFVCCDVTDRTAEADLDVVACSRASVFEDE